MNKRTMKSLVILSIVFILLSANALNADNDLNLKLIAPPMGKCDGTKMKDMGTWDDVFPCRDSDIVVLRRGENLFSLSMNSQLEIKELVSSSALREATIVTGIPSGKRFWLLCHSSERATFALDIFSDKKVDFLIGILEKSGKHSCRIQSFVIDPHSRGVVVMTEGWGLPGNQPVYFWLGFQSGEVVQFPIGWDLEYLSANQETAVFERPRAPRLQAVDMGNGRVIAEIPDRRKVAWVPFDWCNNDSAKPLMEPYRTAKGSANYFAGISAMGSVYTFDIPVDDRPKCSTVKIRDGFAAFRLHPAGSVTVAPSSFWWTPLRVNAEPRLLGEKVLSFEMLHEGRCVFAAAGYGTRFESSEAFVYDPYTQRAWNVLDGVERLPRLDPYFLDKNYVQDKMTVRFIDGFGRRHEQLVLCLFLHHRWDMRALLPGEKKLKEETWNRAVILTATGRRYMTDVLRQGNVPDAITLHNSGRIILERYKWLPTASGKRRKTELSILDLRLGRQSGVLDKPKHN